LGTDIDFNSGAGKIIEEDTNKNPQKFGQQNSNPSTKIQHPSIHKPTSAEELLFIAPERIYQTTKVIISPNKFHRITNTDDDNYEHVEFITSFLHTKYYWKKINSEI
jgi:hypothetical protein